MQLLSANSSGDDYSRQMSLQKFQMTVEVIPIDSHIFSPTILLQISMYFFYQEKNLLTLNFCTFLTLVCRTFIIFVQYNNEQLLETIRMGFLLVLVYCLGNI